MKISDRDNTSVTASMRRTRHTRNGPQRPTAPPTSSSTAGSTVHANVAQTRTDKEIRAATQARIGSLQRKVLAGTITAAEDAELVYLVHASRTTAGKTARRPVPAKTRSAKRAPTVGGNKKRPAAKPLTEPLLIQARAAGVVAARCPTSGMLTRDGVSAAMRECWKALTIEDREQLRRDLRERGYLRRTGGATLAALTNFVTHELEKLGLLVNSSVRGFGARTVSGGLPGFGRRA
ncbi:hypothetical protein [Mycobacteroides chelonae]|uniref:hypothetical protein n=1 Tax=Mycobacteroides chelonae TaxID=1774 RepID=UPI001041ED43|nr:hypothetical protein [Mycobacteroides chelonae]